MLSEKNMKQKKLPDKKWLLSISYEYTGAIETIQADVYKIDGEEICDILNERLQDFYENEAEEGVTS